jgi:membrane-anchored protein YejM (alkaline phosphatase superfamily)
MNLDRIDGLMAQPDGFWKNTMSPLKQMVEEIEAPKRAEQDACGYDVRQRQATYADLEQKTMQVLRTDQADFVFLHLPVPHSPNIWSRRGGGYAAGCGSSYVDNLALADRMLGEMMETMQGSPRWKETTLIVQGDHSWRIRQWNWLPAWTAEDEAASRGVFDPRPALLVHAAGQTEEETNGTAWPVVRVHDVVEAVLRGERLAGF